ncbi:septal ring lytic transglycosylase RlpA family protein [Rhizosphaericola mali]|uniref:Probable endolytic peptidoglycan transglycosylase RlpA n=1 Tax=Rhizosphaericola mali TaxID=2545455 RepID=A0A5P2G9F9_9BACT|nr:septal ring lytic transglycosylase RlpA family protein [Rhizosphaericola mali]QES90360.1 septal ring lytic transglycosylase RlpA family protein [Rhizosphaericola mali]
MNKYFSVLVLSFVLVSCGKYIKQDGHASYYAGKFIGRKTANGETFSKHKKTAASKTLPFGTMVKVTNLSNGKSVKVRINDRGPFVKGRDIDLSWKAAKKIGMLDQGVAPVELKYRIQKK